VPHDVRDLVVDFVRRWSEKAEIGVGRFIPWLGVTASKFYDWRQRYGCVNEHNGWVPRDFWLEPWEKEAIIGFHLKNPLEGYRRLTFMMLDADVVAVSPASVWRVLKQAGLLSRWKSKPSRKGTGFEQPLQPHQHWHIDISYINLCGTFYYLCSVLDGFSRFLVHWDLRARRTFAVSKSDSTTSPLSNLTWLRREQELIRAKSNLELARAQLNTAMGVPMDAVYQPADPLADQSLAVPSLADVEQKALTSRPDLKRIESEQSAQQLSVAIAKSSFGPRLNAFAGWEMDNPTLLAGGGGNNWLGGIELQVDLFQGGAKKAALSREHAIAEKIAALKQAASDAVRLEVRQAYYDVDSNRQQVGVARSSITQAQESLRINQDRYEGGLITITDLLGAEESARRSQTDYWQAVYQFHISSANLELASGTLNLQSPVVNP